MNGLHCGARTFAGADFGAQNAAGHPRGLERMVRANRARLLQAQQAPTNAANGTSFRLRGAPCPKALDAASTLTRLEEDSHEIPIHHRRGWLACQLVCCVCRRCRQEKGPGDGPASG